VAWTRRRFLKLGVGGVVAGGLFYWRACHYPRAASFADVTHLSARGAAILAAVVEAVLPPSADRGRAAVDAHVRAIDAQLGSFPPEARTDVNRLLYLVEQATLPLGGRVRRFSSLTIDERTEVLASWSTSDHDLVRAGLRGLVSLVYLAYYRDAKAFAAIGYPGPMLPAGGFAGDYARLVAPAGTTP
jgi:D-cysteine desulfhydrase